MYTVLFMYALFITLGQQSIVKQKDRVWNVRSMQPQGAAHKHPSLGRLFSFVLLPYTGGRTGKHITTQYRSRMAKLISPPPPMSLFKLSPGPCVKLILLQVNVDLREGQHLGNIHVTQPFWPRKKVSVESTLDTLSVPIVCSVASVSQFNILFNSLYNC